MTGRTRISSAGGSQTNIHTGNLIHFHNVLFSQQPQEENCQEVMDVTLTTVTVLQPERVNPNLQPRAVIQDSFLPLMNLLTNGLVSTFFVKFSPNFKQKTFRGLRLPSIG